MTVSVIGAGRTKHHEDVPFKARRRWMEARPDAEESAAWKEPGCSFQDPRPKARAPKRRQRNVLDRKPGCSLQDGGSAVSDRVAAVARGCAPLLRDGSGGRSSDSRDDFAATCDGCPG